MTALSRDRPGSRLSVLTLIDGVGVVGGGERFARDLTRHLDPERFDRIFCISRWTEDEARDPAGREAIDDLRSAGVEFLGLPRRRTLALRAWIPLLSVLRNRPVDILHSHKFGSNVWGAALGTIARTPVVVAHEQTWSFEGKPFRRILDRELIARRADAFVAVSSEDRRRMTELEGIDPEKIVLLPNAVPGSAPGEGRDVRAERDIRPDQPVIGTVCQLRPQKAIEVLLEAAARLKQEVPGLKVLIAGDGTERAKLEGLAGSLGLQGTVDFLGRRTDVPDVLAALDVAVSSSDFEGTPLALMESMEAGLPIVATRVGGTPDLIEDGVHGLLVPPRNPDALAQSVAELLRDPDRARAMGRRGQERRRSEFDIEVAAQRVGELYQRLYADSVMRSSI